VRNFFLALLLLLPLPVAARLDWDAFTTYGSFADLRREQEKEILEGHLEEIQRGRDPLPSGSKFVAVAIDGAAGSGKTSTARALAQFCGYAFISTGEHYRSISHFLLGEHILASDVVNVTQRLRTLRLSTIFRGCCGHIAINGKVRESEDLRSPEINRAVPSYAAIPVLRNFLHRYERQLPKVAMAAGFGGVVLEGRDVATAVLPEAQLRIYLDVDLEERTRRRAREGLVDDVAERDRRDRQQMEPAKGVWHIDGTNLTLEEVVAVLRGRLSEIGVL
jgi:cytidylate kinase